MIQLFLCPSPELYGLYHRDGAAVLITDIFRASTTMITAMAHGAEAILPVATTEEAQKRGRELGCLIAAERNVRRCDFADLGNDPKEYTPERVGGRRIVLTTTNGTRSLRIAREAGAGYVLIGSMLNVSATLDLLERRGIGEVVVVAAGWQGHVSSEDCLYAGALGYELELSGRGKAMGDAARMMTDLWAAHCLTLEERIDYIRSCEHYERLCSAGHEGAVPYCMQLDSHPIVVGLEPNGDEWLRILD
ncbi:2-phosphosulfolactate phosphatase [Porphyromonas sp. COT-239 OH1446]|uniref:2-phosphosulfolactate phosphatase n=1 Tax=Porphyromonas sp. COT-239 OH1446 TaxID=1515613 RepID=UPI00052C530A|nr:2-phosphosulfolactate phosphatase [Porphyromonas sp. COT-239 OH1446]KGN68433.1 2-phosphosulfolactate phosphatase [Porphyromonas sp. COT-239 OH1446]